MSENNMRVVVLTHVFPRTLDDSMGAFLLHLADALAARGVSIEVVAPHAPNLADDETLSAARVHRFRYAPVRWERLAYTGTMHELVAHGVVNKIWFALFNLAFLIRTLLVVRTSSALIHAHWWLPGGSIGAFVSLLTRTPLVITTHGTDVEMLRRTRWAMPLARFVFSRARAITCGSTYLREQLLALGVADATRVSVIPMPVSPLFENPKSRTENPKLILTVARLTAQKSIDTLISALAILRGRGSPARATIIGDGPERAALKKQVHDLGLQDCVEFWGALPQKELWRYYAECAVFVLPSIREGMGLVLAEALLCGAPVIATDSGGVTDIIRDDETGLLVPEHNAHALADAIERILNDRALAARLAANGRARARERFTAERVAAQFVEIYFHHRAHREHREKA
jgi:glycosyltransferase involved in cell wall biosynthesis